jgi:hypothetical protein
MGGWQAAGIIFRTNDSSAQTYYIFEITVNGTFFVQRNDSSQSDAQLYTESKAPIIHAGLNQKNILAVDASGDSMTFYINGQNVGQRTDSRYSSGLIGVIVGEQFNQSDTQITTEATYNYAKVWVS